MIASERMHYIMNSLYKKGIINLKEIAKEVDVAEITVRRDFEKLEAQGKLKRVLGGATLASDNEDPMMDAELTMKQRTAIHSTEKMAVAKKAIEYVKEEECIFLDAGTSMLPLAELLLKRNVKVVTYNSLILKEADNPRAEVFVIGGKLLPYYSMCVGPFAQDLLSRFHFDVAFIGCAGVDLSNATAYTTEAESLMMKQIALKNSDRRYLLLDSSKLEKKGLFKITDLAGFDAILCNSANQEMAIPANFIYTD